MAKLPVQLFLDHAATSSHAADVIDLLQQYGFEPTLGAPWPTPERGLDPWMIVIGVPAGYFVKALAEQTGKRTADALADLMGKLKRTRAGPGRIEFGDPDQSVIVVVTTEADDEAYDQIPLQNLEAQPGVELKYDLTERVWKLDR
jgi:hypothetical protein